jgi:uncharacterized protein
MSLLIDGYNLLHATGIFGEGTELTELHRSREALLRFLAESISSAERSRTTIVFDAAGAPPGLPKTLVHDRITVHFARDYEDADTMLEELIAAHETPRTLVVVSSDHRVQRAARRRRAKAVDSDRWYVELCSSQRSRGVLAIKPPQKPTATLSPGEVEYWTAQFGGGQQEVDETSVPLDAASIDTDKGKAKKSLDDDEFFNPFPPGYGDDLLDDANG